MDLDGARNAKAEIFERVFTADDLHDLVEPRIALPDMSEISARESVRRMPSMHVAFSVSDVLSTFASRLAPTRLTRKRRAHRSGSRAGPPIAIGIQRSRARQEANLVLIARDSRLRTHPLVERAINLARGEARFVEGGDPRPLSFWQPPRRRPLMLGTSVSHHQVPAGTLGAFVRLADGTVGILSNNHVLADVNRAAIGDPVVQPGKSDGGKAGPEDTIGTLLAFVPLVGGDGTANAVDCAVAALGAGLEPSAQIVGGDGEPALRVTGLATEELFADDAVWKVGRTTGLTNGRVFAIEVDNYVVNMGTPWRPFRCRFDGQIQVYADDRAFAGPGDSGSLLMDHEGMAHALLFAGSASGGPTGKGLAALNPLGLVLKKLDATLWIG